jgi:hypothetical protein
MSTIDQYREAKTKYEQLRGQAKKELLSRFHQLEAEIAQVQRELREDFGVKVSINLKSRPSRSKAPAKTETARERSPKVMEVEKKLVAQKHKLDAARAAGKPTKPIEDRIYELEDELKLSTQ